MTGGRSRRARRQASLSAALLLGIVAAACALAGRVSWRADLTSEREYTLAPATRDLLSRLQDRLQVKLYFNRDLEGAEALLPARIGIEDLLAEMAAASGGRVSVDTEDPTADFVARSHAEHAGIEPVRLASQDVGSQSLIEVWQGLEMRYLDRSETIPFVVPAQFEFAFAARLAALLRERELAIGVFSREPEAPPEFPGIETPPPPGRIFSKLRQVLRQRYEVRDVPLDRGLALHEELSLLIAARPEGMSEREVFELDQFLARGGHVLVLWDGEEYRREGALDSLERRAIQSGLDAWLKGQGVHPSPHLLWDQEAWTVPAGAERVTLPGGQPVTRTLRLPYGFWPVLSGDSLSRQHVVTVALDRVALLWAHPLAVQSPPAGVEGDVLLQSSPRSWVLPADTPAFWSFENLESLPRRAASTGPAGSYPLAVALRGAFPSRFDPASELAAGGLASASAPGLLVVVGDSDLFHDAFFEAGQPNAVFAENLVDWMVQDPALIELRSRGRRDRPIRNFYRESIERQGGPSADPNENQEMDRVARRHARSSQRLCGWGNVLAPPLLVLLLALVRWRRGRFRASA